MFPSNRKKRWVAFLYGGVWTMRQGYGAMRGTPVGRQFASGSRPEMRDSIRALAAGSKGIVSPFVSPCSRSPTGPPPLHTPERSTDPSGRRGVGPEGADVPERPPAPAGEVGAAGSFPPEGRGA